MNISLAAGETCTFRVQAKCGLPTFAALANVTGVDIQVVDFDDDDIDAVASPIKAQQMALNVIANITKIITNITNSSAAMKAMKHLNESAAKLQRAGKGIDIKSIVGPIAKSFNVDEGAKRQFKGGLKRSADEALCKARYQQISITPLVDIANATATRIL